MICMMLKYICMYACTYAYVCMYICTGKGINMALSAKKAVIKFKVELLQELPLEQPLFFAMAERAGLFPLTTNESIKAKETRGHKVEYFLDYVVMPGADVYLPQLLRVMRESEVGNVIRLADDIQATLQSGICLCVQYVHMYIG